MWLAELQRGRAGGAGGTAWPGGPQRPRRTPRRLKSSHNAALASQFRYNVSAGAGEPARRGRGSREAAAVTRAPGRGWRPRAASVACPARGPAKGRSRPAARPGPQPGPHQKHQPLERAGRRLRCPRSSGAPHRARRPAPRRASLARQPAVAAAAALEAAPAPGTTAARALAYSRSPARGVLTHLVPAGEVRGEGAPGSRGLPPERRARPTERRGRRLAGLRGRGQALGGHRAPSAAAFPSARAGPTERPTGAAQLRN